MLDRAQSDMSKLERFLDAFQKRVLNDGNNEAVDLNRGSEAHSEYPEIKDRPEKRSLNMMPQAGYQRIVGKLDESNLYVIKLPDALKPHFTELFNELDRPDLQKELNIQTYNVRVTSLEEVFNALGEEELAT